MAIIIKGVAVEKDAFQFVEAPQPVNINCEGAKLEEIGWAVPVTQGGVVQSYTLVLVSPSKPSVDSIRVAVIRTADDSLYWLVVPDDATNNTFTDKCNACCGSTPEMPAVTLPVPITENCPCLDSNGTSRTWNWPLPYNPNTMLMGLVATFDGAASPTTYGGAGFANAAALLSYLTINWSALGTWSLQNSSTVLRLVSTTVKCAGLQIPLKSATYCLSFPTDPAQVDSIVIGSNTVMFPDGPISISSASPAGLQFVLSQLLIGTISVQAGSPSKLTYVGQQVPVKLQLAGVDVVSFTVGACAWTFNFSIPADAGNYSVTQPVFNGVASVPDITGQAFADAATMLAWFIANMAAYGTWSLQSGNTVLRLVSGTTYTATNLTITSA